MKTLIFFILFLFAIRVAQEYALLFLIACFFLNAIMTRYEYRNNKQTTKHNKHAKRQRNKDSVNTDNQI